MVDRMFPFITIPNFNPVSGKCRHACYDGRCWSSLLTDRYGLKKYLGDEPFIVEKEMRRVFKKGDFVFIEDMNDLYGSWVPIELILRVLKYTDLFPDANFLSCTKNPQRYVDLIEGGYVFSKNHFLGCTLETNRDMPCLARRQAKATVFNG